MNYRIKNDFKNYSGNDVWNHITKYIKENKCFHSVSGIEYEAQVIGDSLSFKGGTGNRGINGEIIKKEKFVKTYNAIEDKNNINTTTEVLKKHLNRQRTPFVGLLLSAGIINN